MASFMGKEQQLVYHGDASLHDQTDVATSLLTSLPSGVLSFLNLAVKRFSPEEVKNQCSKLDINHPLSKLLTRKMISMLYGSLLHPPVSYLGQFNSEKTAQSTDNIRLLQYRNADGSDNNILFPNLGKAGFPYAKSVSSQRAIHGTRPAPEDLFDLLMATESPEKRRKSKSGISSMLLYHATIIIHDIFRSNKDDRNISDTSSYLDLTPLYGRSRRHQEAVRLMERGHLKPDSFAEERLLMQPPGVCAYLIMYSRFHNYVAEQLLSINENGRFRPADYDMLDTKKKAAADQKQDEDLFQTARLVTTGLYINISIHDYLRVLMGVHTKNTAWTLDPRIEIPEAHNKAGVQRGIGNQVSAEFNVLYRFHSPISQIDADWTLEFMKDSLAEFIKEAPTDAQKKAGFITHQQLENGEIPIQLMAGLLKAGYDEAEKSVINERPFIPDGIGGRVLDHELKGFKQPIDYKMKRNAEGKFDDNQLVKCMVTAMDDPICQFGAMNQPKTFRTIEILGILQARKWELATLNEFREFFGLSRHRSFEDINGNPVVQQRLRNLYEDPDMVELYPGLFCEGNGDWVSEDQVPKDTTSSEYTKCNNSLDPGNSCPGGQGTALWRGVFSDAVTLVRSDRFYTIDWNVGSLTAWGMNEVSSDPKILKGSVFHRLFQRAFPGYFNFDSLYLWQPFYTLEMNAKLADEQGHAFDLDVTPKNKIPAISIAEKEAKYTELEYRKFVPFGPDPVKTVYTPKAGTKRNPIIEVNDYATIKDVILGSEKDQYPFPGIGKSVPTKGPLRDVLTNQRLHDEATALLGNLDFYPDKDNLFLEYFLVMSKQITAQRKRRFQRSIRQIDIVRDFVIPIVTRFVCDFLGFEDHPETKDANGKFNENQIYSYISNVQEFLSINADEATRWKRRIAFRESLEVLQDMSEYGVRKAQGGLWGYLTDAIAKIPEEPIPKLKACGHQAAKLLLKSKPNIETAAAFMLVAVLDAAHKTVLMFSNVLDYLLMNKRIWDAVKKVASSGSNQDLEHYVLEIQRLAVDLPLLRKYEPKNSKGQLISNETGVKGAKPGDILVLQVKQASQDPPFKSPANEVNLSNHLKDYIIYGQAEGDKFDSKKLTILGLTGMLKYVAGLENLRYAKDEAGYLKRVKAPGENGLESYLTVKWDQLVPFPTTWNLRFDEKEEGAEVANGHIS